MLRTLGTEACHEKLVMGRPSFFLSTRSPSQAPGPQRQPREQISRTRMSPRSLPPGLEKSLRLRSPLPSADFLPSDPSPVLNSFVLCLAVQFRPPLLRLSSPCVSLMSTVISHTCSPSQSIILSAPSPPVLPPASCSSHYFIYLFPEAGAFRPPLVSRACFPPGPCPPLRPGLSPSAPPSTNKPVGRASLRSRFPGWSCHGNKSAAAT